MEKEYNYLDKKIYDIPNVIDMSVNEALKNLKHFKVEFSGTGNKVIYQSPKAGERIEEGSSIRLLVGE